MAFITAPTLPIRQITWVLSRPAQINVSQWTGRRSVVANPWHGKWRASVQLRPIVGEANIAAIRGFLAECMGPINTFRLYATEGDQNQNDAVTVSSTAAAGVTSISVTGTDTPMTKGQFVTVNGQLLQLTANQAGAVLAFQPQLRAQAAAGTAVVTRRPYALVHLASQDSGWSVEAGQVYSVSFDVEEAVLEADGAAPETAVLPANSVAPALTGTPTVGQVLTLGNGTWSGAPSLSKRYLRSGAPIYGQTGGTYTLTPNDLGHTIQGEVTDAVSGRVALSNTLGPVTAPAVPVNTVLPVVSGSLVVGGVLSSTTGTFNNGPTSYAYQWLRNGSEISGANASTYVQTTADIGKTLSVRVVASNANGASLPATSNSVGPVVGYDVDLDFRRGTYKNGSNTYGALSAYAGYSFARSGVADMGVVDADGTVDFFATNIPPVTARGYHSYMGMANLLSASGFVGGTELDPAGGNTARSITVQENQTFTVATGVTHTVDLILKASSSNWTFFRVEETATPANSIRVWANLATGVLGTTQMLGAGLTFVGVAYIRPLANGFYRVGFQFQSATATGLSLNIRGVTNDLATTHTGNIIGYWRQVLATTCLDCPLIPNGAGTGGTRLELAAALQPGTDMIAYEALNLEVLPSTWRAFEFNTAGGGGSVERLVPRTLGGGTAIEFQPRSASVTLAGPTNLTGMAPGRIVIGLGRRNGRWFSFYRSAAGVLTVQDDAPDVGVVPAITAVEIGSNADGTADQVNGVIERFKVERGTFTNAQLAAKVEEILL